MRGHGDQKWRQERRRAAHQRDKAEGLGYAFALGQMRQRFARCGLQGAGRGAEYRTANIVGAPYTVWLGTGLSLYHFHDKYQRVTNPN